MKVLLPDLAGRQELADRFLREIKLLASLDHPNIAQLRTALTLSNRLVMVMEYVEHNPGRTSRARSHPARRTHWIHDAGVERALLRPRA